MTMAMVHNTQPSDEFNDSSPIFFHKKYLNGKGEVEKLFLDFAEIAQSRLKRLMDDCSGEGEDEEIREALNPCRQEEILSIENAIRALEDGTFTFKCEENCALHPKNGGKCVADLTEEKLIAFPGATNCAKLREQMEELGRGTPIARTRVYDSCMTL